MRNLLYVPLVGIWICTFMVAVGLLLCATIIGIPIGITFMALGVKMLTLKPISKIVIQTEQGRT